MKTPSSEGEGLNGRVINLLTNDVGKFDLCCIFLMEVWRAPIESSIVIYIMYRNIGPASLIGVAFLLCFIPLQGLFYLNFVYFPLNISLYIFISYIFCIYIHINSVLQNYSYVSFLAWFSHINAGLRVRTALKTDHRIKIMNEIIQGIQMIKMYAWENCFVKMIAFARK